MVHLTSRDVVQTIHSRSSVDVLSAHQSCGQSGQGNCQNLESLITHDS